MRLRDLDPGQLQRVMALLDEALELPPEERAGWQRQLAAREPALADLIAQLLTGLPSSLEDNPYVGMPRVFGHGASLLGQLVGPYRVLRELGHGGMGLVWLAERADGLFERQVALKLPYPGVAGGSLLARFSRERSILAALEHPLIARLLDAGLTPQGQPYLALEYVEGTSLTEYCDAQRASIRERITLMMQVLSAVQHAHQALIIHRDLKPSNILVARDGTVRLLDFGIAKLIAHDERDKAEETELTALGGRVFTPDYASPEQIAGQPIGVASDVYALGVVLYMLLCGRRPYRLERSTLGALEEAILSATPTAPSQQPLDETIAAARSTGARRLARMLAGDLDTIALKALKKDPAERYPTAEALRRDLQRFLDGEPVEARRDGFAYRSAKLMKRHWVAVSAGATIAALLFGAAFVSLRQAQLARAQAHIAQREAARARAVQAFLLGVFRGNSDQQADPIRARQATARELLDEGSRRIGDSLRSSPETQAEILDTLANMYHQLGLHEDAARLRRQRVAALRRAYGDVSAQVAEGLIMLGEDLDGTDDREGFAATLREAEVILDGIGDDWSDTRANLWLNYASYAKYVSVADMQRYASKAQEHTRRHASTYFWSNRLNALQLAARASYLAGDDERAEAGFYATLREIDQRGQTDSAWSVTPLVWLAEAEQHAMRLAAAEQNLQHALALSRRFNGPLHGATLQTQTKLAGLWHATGRREQGMRLLDETQATLERAGANATPNAVATLRRIRGQALFEEGRFAEAAASFAAELNDVRLHLPGSIPLAQMLVLDATVQTALGHYALSAAEIAEAERLWRKCAAGAVDPATFDRYHLARARLALARGDLPGVEQALRPMASAAAHSPRDLLTAELVRARELALNARWGEVAALAANARKMLDAWPHADRFPRLRAEVLLLSGQAQLHSGDPAAAQRDLERSIALRVANEAETSPWLAEARLAVAEAALNLGQSARAQALTEQAAAALAAFPELGDHFKAPLRRLEQRQREFATRRARRAPG